MIFGKSFFRRHKSDILNILYISVAFWLLILIIMAIGTDGIWGSKTDWQSQHFAIPEYIRSRFYKTGDLFPDFAPQIGGGQNIYNLSYYGLLNPVYILAYLMPDVTMADYIQSVSLISVQVSCILFYILTKRHFDGRLPLFLTMLFMFSAPLVFQSHRHVMFVAYIPFQITGMLAAGNEDSVLNRGILIFSSYCILCTSFYFSISAFAVILIYGAFVRLKRFRKLSIIQLLRLMRMKLTCIFLGCLSAGMLWLPTFYTLISGREGGTSFVNVMKLIIPTVNTEYLLYSPYSVGMTSIAVISLLALMRSGDKAERMLACVFTGLVCCPVIIYLCNGTMYLDPKVLIPFLPLLVIAAGCFTVRLMHGKVRIFPLGTALIIVLLADFMVNYRELQKILLLAADAAATLTVLSVYIKTRKRRIFFIPVTIFAVINCMAVNLVESYVSQDTMNELYSEDVQELADKAAASDRSFYRFADNRASDVAVNRIYGDDYYSANIYSSVSNKYYRDFRFNGSSSGNSHRNNALQSQPENVIFNVLMGCRYRISDNPAEMAGECQVDSIGGKFLFCNENALPAGYACANIMNEEQWKKLDCAQRSEAILENIIVPERTGLTAIPSESARFEPEYRLSGDTSNINAVNDAYEIKSDSDFSICAELDEPVENKLIFVQFHADNRVGKKSERGDIWVRINGIKNTLSAPDWKYHNKNYDFSYVISSEYPVSRLEFEFSKGDYILSDFKLYTLDESVLREAGANKDEFIIDRDTMGGDTIQGTINVTSDGWFNLSVAYDKGFEVLVDGVETEYFRTNTAFIGFPVNKGEHSITINYHAPFHTAGIILSLSGVTVSVCMLLYMYVSERKRIRVAVPV